MITEGIEAIIISRGTRNASANDVGSDIPLEVRMAYNAPHPGWFHGMMLFRSEVHSVNLGTRAELDRLL